ncbi:MAG: hypothetical protein NTY12_00820 [Candidatus Falkowbacteria bacterium]|nr:hypothetical protein [Candidatus Falkowbacteria bacterium]
MNIKNILAKLDIKDKKADLYLACLESGGSTAYFLAKKVGLKRPTAYDALYSLLKEGLVHASIKKNSKYFYPADPEILMQKLKEKEQDLLSALPILQSLYNSPKIIPNVKYFEGKEGIKEMSNDSLKTLKKGGEILIFCGDDVLRYIPKYAEEYIKARVDKGIRVRGIYKKTPEIIKYMDKNLAQLRTVKIVDEKFLPMNNEINIYGNKIAISSYGKEMFGMIIESEEIARSQRAIFELAWRGANEIC